MTAIAGTPWIQALGWALIQFLWQGTVIWAAFAVTRAMTRRRLGARARYALACGALGAMTITPLWTFHEQLVEPLAPALTIWSPTMWRSAAPWCVGAWMCGVLAFCWRLADGWRVASRLRSIGTESAPDEWHRTLELLARRAGVARAVRLLTSSLIEVPIVIGWWRPVILAPVAMLAGLPPQYLDSMLAHELAHIRRADYLVNLVQGVVEAVLFYHPAVWWVSREIRFERERCCDDEAVKLVGDVVAYAQALAALESRRPAHRQALAATGGSLVERVRRLLGQAPTIEVLPGAGVMAAMSAVWLVGISAVGTHAAPSAPPVLRAPAPVVMARAITPSPRPALSSLLFAPIGPNVEAPQASVTTPNSALIIGHVVDADSGAAVAGAIVELRLSPSHSAQGSGADAGFLVLNNVQLQGGGLVIGQPGSKTTTVLTGGDGQFVFRNLPAGHGDFTVTANGYTGGAYHQLRPDGAGQSLDIVDGQHVSDIALKMWKNGAISGRITDESSEPVVGARVQVLRRLPSTGQWQAAAGMGMHFTDDRGVYRAAGLLPGDYVVEVPVLRTTTLASVLDLAEQGRQAGPAGRGQPEPLPSGQLLGNVFVKNRSMNGNADAITPIIATGASMTAYSSTFYPAASTSSRATVITLKSAEEKPGIDIQLAAMRVFRVSGALADLDGSPAAGVAIHLFPMDRPGTPDPAGDEMASTATGPRGEFTLAGIPSGQYLLLVLRFQRATSARGGRGAGPGTVAGPGQGAPDAWVRQAVSVGESDVAGLALVMHPAITVTGRVMFEGSSTQPANQQLQRGIRAQQMDEGARGAANGAPLSVIAQLSTDGSFSMTGLTPGTYQFTAPGWPLLKWTPKSVVIAGQDVSDATVDLDSDLSNVVVTFTDQPGVLAGSVHRSSGEIDATALVVGFPVDPRTPRGTGMHMFTQRVEADGTYTVPLLAPGAYNVVAISDTLAQNWQDPVILQKLIPLATRVRVDDGMHVKQDLTTSVVR